ncbi:MAG TPA: hypothetical protein VMH92_00495 [Acidocella sp.]|nr:hypothetical protein [Acidocella sp.]
MIVRPFTFLAGLLFALSGAYLFVVKHQSQALEDQLEQVAEGSRQDEQSIRVLQAQWALEADPSRIAALAAQFTGLQPMQPGQLVTLASLASSLPAPGSAAPYSNPQDEVPAIPGAGNAPAAPSGPPIEVQGHLAAAQEGRAVTTASAVPARPAPATQQLADNAAPSATVPPRRPVHPRATERHAAARLASAESVPHALPEALVRQAAAHRVQAPSALYAASASAIAPAGSASHQTRMLPMGAQVMRVRATAEAAVEPQLAAPLGGGSLLGMAQTGSQN